MKKILFLLIFFISSYICNAQSISVSPTSFSAWGQAKTFKTISVEYKSIGIHYFHGNEDDKMYDSAGKEFWGKYNSTFGISFIPINIKDIVRAGTIYTFKNFPTTKSNKLNFWVEAGYNFKSFRISYVHISNGFGITNHINPGMDRIRLTFEF